jgi:Mrp family chromosome partitioning ATPase
LADAPLLASVVEATVLVIESRRSRTHDVQDMVRRLAEAGANIAGVIITKVSLKRSRYGYGYGYYGYAEPENDKPADSARRISA